MRRVFFGIGITAHLMFLVVFMYMAGFVGNLWVPKSIDSRPNPAVPTLLAFVIDLGLLVAFAVPHSVMARPAFKKWWTQFVPPPIERSVYVLISNFLMIALLAFWCPINSVVYDLANPIAGAAMWSLFVFGWLLVPLSSMMISHFDLFGTRQVWLHLRQKAYTQLPFRTPMLYGIIRHPIYLGWIIAFWATPTMTVGHALFAVTLTAYMLAAIPIEERDLITYFGDAYIKYRRTTGGLLPKWTPRKSPMPAPIPIPEKA